MGKHPMLPEDLSSLKKLLIKSNGESFRSGLAAGDIDTFQTIYTTLTTAEGTNSLNVLCCDVLSIWIVRYNQSFKQDQRENPAILVSETEANSLFQYVVDFIDQPSGPFVNALNTLLTRLIDLVKVTFSAREKEIYELWIEKLMKLATLSRPIYQLADIIGKHIDTHFILDKYPQFPNKCLSAMRFDALANSAGRALATIYKGVYIKVDTKNGAQIREWMQLWQHEVLTWLKHEKASINIQKYLLPLLFTISPQSFFIFMEDSFKNKLKEDHNSKAYASDEIDIIIRVAKIGQDLAIETQPFNPVSKKTTIPFHTVTDLMTHVNPQYRLDAFALFVGSPKSSQSIPDFIFQTIIERNVFNVFFMDYDDTAIRNDFCSYMRQFLIRIRDSSYSAHRDLLKLRKKNDTSLLPKEETLDSYIDSTRSFMKWFLEFLQKNVAPGSNYAQISVSLQMLQTLIQLGLDNDLNMNEASQLKGHKKSSATSGITFPYSIEIFDENLIRLLMDNITNNYEDLREYSVNLLLLCPANKLDELILNDSQLRKIHENTFQILADLKGRKSEGGARVFQFLAQAYQKSDNRQKVLQLCDSLMTKIENATQNFEQKSINTSAETALLDSRLHGIFAALRLILSGISTSNFEKEKTYWEVYFSKILESYAKIWNAVKPILSSTNGDYSQIENNISETVEVEVEEKLILNYSWKVVKESSSLLQTVLDLSCKKRLALKNDDFLDVVFLIIEQLSTVNHRGAFSSVYPTFITCCEICLLSTDTKLSDMQSEWLRSNINLIESKAQAISRRSGGLPYLITGILTAEKTIKNTNKGHRQSRSELIDYSMEELLRIASIHYVINADEKMDIPQVHAFNSMKHIFIDSQLSDESIYYVKDALKLSLINCNSGTWAIRNCAVMLFTALQNRLFGTKKLGNILPTLNAKAFFVKYQGVKEILLDTLQDALAASANMESVFPVMTILMRLEDSDDIHSTSSLQPFQPILKEYTGNSSWKIREIASMALAAIIIPANIDNYVYELIEEVINNESIPPNKIHGILLTVQEIHKRIHLKLPYAHFPEKCWHLIWKSFPVFFKRDGNEFMWAIRKAYVDIIQCGPRIVVPEDVEHFLSNYLIESYFSKPNDITISGLEQLFLRSTIELLLNENSFLENKESIELINLCVYSHNAHEVQLAGISFLNNNLKALERPKAQMLSTELQHLCDDLWKEIISNDKCWSYVRSCALRTYQGLITTISSKPNRDSKELLDMITLLFGYTDSDNFSEDVNVVSLEVLGTMIPDIDESSTEDTYSDKFFDLVHKFARDENPFVHRMSAIKAASSYLLACSAKNNASYFTVKASLELYLALWDDDKEIRDLSSEALSASLNLKVIAGNIATAQYFSDNASNICDKSHLEDILIPIFCGKKNSTSELLNLIEEKELDEDSLFDIESENLYRNEQQQHVQLVNMIRQVSPLKPHSIALLQSSITEDLLSCSKFIERRGADGYLGWSKSEFTYNALFKLIINLNLIKELNLFTLDDSRFKSSLILLDIHPGIKKLLD